MVPFVHHVIDSFDGIDSIKDGEVVGMVLGGVLYELLQQ